QAPRFLKPPYNMICEDDLIARFGLSLDPEDTRFDAQPGGRYTLNAASPGQHLLGHGWSPPESWGTWSEGDESLIRFRLPRQLQPNELTVTLEMNVLDSVAPCSRELELT